MEWWQVILFLLACIAGGSVIFILLAWLVSLSERERQTTALGALTLLFISEEPEAPSTDPKLLAQVRNNLRITSEPWAGELIPFDTSVWDTQQYEVYRLPTNLRNDLKQVHVDMALANQIVWLSTEFNRKSQNLDEAYRIVRTGIAERLRRIAQNLE